MCLMKRLSCCKPGQHVTAGRFSRLSILGPRNDLKNPEFTCGNYSKRVLKDSSHSNLNVNQNFSRQIRYNYYYHKEIV